MFIGENLKAVRVVEGESRKSLAALLGVSEQAVWQYETQNIMPDINKINMLARQFHVKPQFFFTDKQRFFGKTAVDFHAVAFRSKNQKTSTKLLSQNYAQANFYVHFTDYLLAHVKQPPLPIFHLMDVVEQYLSQEMDNRTRIQCIANEARAQILDGQTNEKLLFALEKFGVTIYEKDLTNEADAYSFWSNSQMPFIILSDNKGVAVRRNFDLAHELGHLLLHRQVEFDMLTHEMFQQIEKEADIFAAEFLMPESTFIDSFAQIKKKSNPDYLVLLKEKWFVSIQAIAMRAYYLGLLSNSQYRYFWASINKKGYKKREPLDTEMKLPQPVKMNSLLNMLLTQKVLTPERILDEFQVQPDFLYQKANVSQKLFEQFMENEAHMTQNEVLQGFVSIDQYR